MTSVAEILSPGSTTTSQIGVGNSTLGQEDFLELMVAQLENQDPTNPADSTELFSQISQFSMVEGIENMSSSFDDFSRTFSESQGMNYVSLIGRNVMTQSNAAYFDGENQIAGVLDLPSSASSAVVYVQDEYGTVLDEIEMVNLPAGQTTFNWPDNESTQGNLEEGNYYFSSDAFMNGQSQAVPVYGQNRVESVSWEPSGSGYELSLSSGETINSSSLRGIFN